MDYESGIGLSDHVKIEVMKGEQKISLAVNPVGQFEAGGCLSMQSCITKQDCRYLPELLISYKYVKGGRCRPPFFLCKLYFVYCCFSSFR